MNAEFSIFSDTDSSVDGRKNCCNRSHINTGMISCWRRLTNLVMLYGLSELSDASPGKRLMELSDWY